MPYEGKNLQKKCHVLFELPPMTYYCRHKILDSIQLLFMGFQNGIESEMPLNSFQ